MLTSEYNIRAEFVDKNGELCLHIGICSEAAESDFSGVKWMIDFTLDVYCVVCCVDYCY